MLTTIYQPCPEQEEIMKSLGFELCPTYIINCSSWTYKVEDIIINIELYKDEVPSYKNIATRIIWKAFRIGEERKRNQIIRALEL